jgi:hypothetical protein
VNANGDGGQNRPVTVINRCQNPPLACAGGAVSCKRRAGLGSSFVKTKNSQIKIVNL